MTSRCQPVAHLTVTKNIKSTCSGVKVLRAVEIWSKYGSRNCDTFLFSVLESNTYNVFVKYCFFCNIS